MKKILVALLPVVLATSTVMRATVADQLTVTTGIPRKPRQFKQEGQISLSDAKKQGKRIKEKLPTLLFVAEHFYLMFRKYKDALKIAQVLENQSYDTKMQWKAKILKGNIYARQGLLDKASKMFMKVAKQKSFEDRSIYAKFTMFDLGISYYRKGKIEKALKMYKQASQQNKHLDAKYFAFTNMGSIHRDKNDFKKATLYYDRAINQNDSPDAKYFAKYEKSILLRNQKKFTEEEELLRQVIERNIFSEITKLAEKRLKELKTKGLIK